MREDEDEGVDEGHDERGLPRERRRERTRTRDEDEGADEGQDEGEREGCVSLTYYSYSVRILSQKHLACYSNEQEAPDPRPRANEHKIINNNIPGVRNALRVCSSIFKSASIVVRNKPGIWN